MPFQDAVIAFDLDGTLVESAPDLIGTVNLMLAERGLAPLPLAAARHLVGGGAARLLERGFTAAGAVWNPADKPAMVEHFIALYRDRIAEESFAFPGVAETLDALRAEGCRLLVCTNKRTDLSLALLDAVHLLDRFEAVVGADAVSRAKPDAAHLLEAIAKVGGDRAHALMVGDSAADVNAAKAAGVPVVAVSFGYTEVPARDLGADAVIDRFADLIAPARRLLSRAA
jgi:phosphoglycolate phosphatase